ncbi:hypothetical protein HGRIS_012462 [Hohenbuehelia grisea]|uniref:Uncharacterized protein n=1 Tax=Hohenbuehelia grisea TaxID=104357 RepID=A0ABR3ISC6_9AGAR
MILSSARHHCTTWLVPTHRVPVLRITRRFTHNDNRDNADLDDLREKSHRQRKTEWKRRQGGQTFLDHLIINVRGGSGGNGCAAFHREKFIAYGPPSGGDGGRGGDVYILPTPHLTTLSSIPKRIRGEPGGHGQGTWQNGKGAAPTIIKVPLGTVVRELKRDDPRRAKDEWEAEEESLQGLDPSEKREKMRANRWVHYPRSADDNVERDSFKVAEQAMYKLERERRFARRTRLLNPIHLDLDQEEKLEVPVDAPLGVKRLEPMGHLVASGGQGGVGNPHFVSTENRSPKFATRGQEGERITLSLELKLLADIGLVGLPNAGKSTLLRALTGGRVKSEVASYAFTTLNPVVGVVRVAGDGSYEGGLQQGVVYGETAMEELLHPDQSSAAAATEDSSSSPDLASANPHTVPDPQSRADAAESHRPGHHFDIIENFRFTIADNPGLIEHASDNVGLGHSFLRAMERSLALVYVIDFSNSAPWDELVVLRDELEKYQPGLSAKARMVIANKADLLAPSNDAHAVEEAKQKLQFLQDFVAQHMVLESGRQLDVVPASAKFNQNLQKIVGLMTDYVRDARAAQ